MSADRCKLGWDLVHLVETAWEQGYAVLTNLQRPEDSDSEIRLVRAGVTLGVVFTGPVADVVERATSFVYGQEAA